MSKWQSYEDHGSEEVVVDVCSFCATRDKIEQANHFCYDCGVFGRYICGKCKKHHDISTAPENHEVNNISGETNIRRERMDELRDIEMRHRAEFEQHTQEKDEDMMELEQQVNNLSFENTKYRAEITRLNQDKEKQDIKMRQLMQEKEEQHDHFEMLWKHQMGKVGEKYHSDVRAMGDEIQAYQNEIDKFEKEKHEMIEKFERRTSELLEENAELQSDIMRFKVEKEKQEAKIKELMQQKDAQYIELARRRQDSRAELKNEYTHEIDSKTNEI